MARNHTVSPHGALLRIAAIALPAALVMAVSGAPRAGQAAPDRSLRMRTCFMCRLQRPTISVSNLVSDPNGTADTGYLQVDPSSASVDVAGARFTPGDPVHVELISESPDAGPLMAEGNTTASYALTIPLGDGQYVHIPGGSFTIALTPDPSSAVACNWQQMNAFIVATDTSSGARASTAPLAIGAWWENNEVLPRACPTDTPETTATVTPGPSM